jgi:hypothetical protein
MANIQVTFETSTSNARSESNIAINPNNPLQVVAASKRFVNIETYDFTLATSYSVDGGKTWKNSASLATPGFTVMTDPTLAWDDIGNIYIVGLTGTLETTPPVFQTIGMVVYKSTDGGANWSAPKSIHNDPSDDKQWAAGDTNPSSPYRGNVYAVWDFNGGTAFARTQDHGATWIGAGSTTAGSSILTGTVYPEIDVSADGTIYIASLGGNEIILITSFDGGATFEQTTSPATGITTVQDVLPPTDSGFPVLPGGTFRVLTDPTCCSSGPTVYVAWADYRDGVSRIYYALSNDAGQTWTTGPSGKPLLISPPANMQHFHPQIVIDPKGIVGCTYYEFGPKPTTYLIDVIISQSFDKGASFDYFIVTDQPWNPATDAPLAEAFKDVTFIGDYFGLDANVQGFLPLWTDTRTGVQDLWSAIVPEKGCAFVINRSTIGQDEVDALRKSEGGDALVQDAFRVVVDGFDAATLGLNSPSSLLNVASPIGGMTIQCTGNASTSGGYGPGPQRFTFFYNLDFGTDSSDPAFAFSAQTETVTLSVAAAGVSAAGQVELIKQPDPYLLHGDPAWLSIDLRVFAARPGDTKAGVAMGADQTKANDFIQKLARALIDLPNGSQIFDDPTVFPSDEEASALYLSQKDEHNVLVFNFALARVRYHGLIGAQTVRVFFRLFAAQSTTGIYDYPPGEQYRRATNMASQSIPLAGVIGPDYVTIPFFALPRVDTTQVPMTSQQDSQTVGGVLLGNIQNISGNASGDEVDTFFGCWLDINQPTKPNGSANNVLPLRADPSNYDGKFTDPGNPPLPMGQAMMRNLHQCIVAEVAFDPVSIPLGLDPSNSDKLAQRNIAWADVGSAEAATTFEVRPTLQTLPQDEKPDELMIDWGTTPIGSVAQIYLPGTGPSEILSMASRMYMRNPLSRVDDHTVKCRAHGVTYVPVPRGAGSNLAGLLTIETPLAMRRGKTHTVVVRQVTNATGYGGVRGPDKPARGRGRARTAAAPESAIPFRWRRVIGAFQLTMPVKQKSSLLPREELGLGVLKWIAEAIPHHNRWHPVFHRYLGVISGRVTSFGGDPGKIWPSPIGLGGGPGGGPGGGGPGSGAGGGPGGGAGAHERDSFTGKIAGIRYDGFGDFEGFDLETLEGRRHRFDSIEPQVLALTERAWIERILTTVVALRHDPRRPLEIILHGAPPKA